MANRFMFFGPKAEPKRQARVAAKKPLSDTLSPTVDERTAEMASAVLENPAFERVFERLRTARLAEFANSELGTAGELTRDKAHLGLIVLDQIKSELEAMADELKLHRHKNS